jgi:hypothetical protein
MTVGELQKILESIQDKNTTVVVFDPTVHNGRYGLTPPTDALLFDCFYLGNGRYSKMNLEGSEPERILIIQ